MRSAGRFAPELVGGALSLVAVAVIVAISFDGVRAKREDKSLEHAEARVAQAKTQIAVVETTHARLLDTMWHRVRLEDTTRSRLELTDTVAVRAQLKRDSAAIHSCIETLESACAERVAARDRLIASLQDSARAAIAVASRAPPRLSGSVAALYAPLERVPELNAELELRVAGRWSVLGRGEVALLDTTRIRGRLLAGVRIRF